MLCWREHDFEKQTVKISRQLVANPKVKEHFQIEEYSVIERDPKTENSFRILRVPKAVMKEMERRLQKIQLDKECAGETYEDNGYVSCQENGRPRGLGSFNQALTKLCNRNGLHVITVHGLRHMFVAEYTLSSVEKYIHNNSVKE